MNQTMPGWTLLDCFDELVTNITDDMNSDEDYATSGMVWLDKALAEQAAASWNDAFGIRGKPVRVAQVIIVVHP